MFWHNLILPIASLTFFHQTPSVPKDSRAASKATPAAWYQKSLVGMEVGPTGAQFGGSDPNDKRYVARFDGKEIVRRCVQAHCQYVVLWARDGDFAYYNSRILQKAPGLGDQDPLRDAVAEAKRSGIPLIAYCVVQQGGHYLAAHPEFEMRGSDGKPLGRFCLNSGYLEAMKQIVAEQLAYGIDGFHIDMLDQGFGAPYGCWCDTCRAQFRKEFSTEMPLSAAWDADWDRMLEFRYASSKRFEIELARYIHGINPRASVDFNYHGNPPFSFEVGQKPVQHAQNGDFVTGETGVWGFSALTVGLNAEFYRAADPQQRVQVAMQRGVRMYHDQTTRPLNDIRWELFTLLAHGAFVTMVDKTGFDGRLDPVAYARIGKEFAEARSMQGQFGQTPVQEVGIYFSHRTRDWVGRERASTYFQSFQGAHRAMVYEHIPYGVLLDENAVIKTLKRFKVVILPNTAILSNSEIEKLTEYVQDGGSLIVTGTSGCADQMGAPAAESALAKLTGGRFVRRLDSQDNWVKLSSNQSPFSHMLSRNIEHATSGTPFLVKGAAIVLEPTTAVPIGRLMSPARTTRQREGKETADWPMSPDKEVGPAVLLNRVGRGQVLTFACSPDFATASEHGVVEARKLLSNAVRLLNPTPTLKISAPANVESVVTDDPVTHTLRIHLLAYNSPPQTTPASSRPFILPSTIEDAPITRTTIELANPVQSARAINPATRIERTGNRLRVTMEDIHDTILIRYAANGARSRNAKQHHPSQTQLGAGYGLKDQRRRL